ncbi:filamentous hemagglutinin N-terminal domain-containing protein [Nostoc sp. CALU 546]|uniref:two-partner secretion domain-containing protein n=1 Tax=Nostoc sp. CALU 546 TaxID=1867241 RepID=UPI003B6813E2
MHKSYFSEIGIAVNSLIFLLVNNAFAQNISPDTTLPNNTLVNTGGNVINIAGGMEVNNNLFHSFSEFSIPTGTTAAFQNATNIQNIISRVTGRSISNIDGLIQANGIANLFLINPNGIIFGENARLDIGGSFLASSANSIQFTNNVEFSAIAPQPNPLLSINVPIGLQLGSNVGNVIVQGANLQVNSGQTLALIGGNISMDGGQLIAAGGRIELGGLIAPDIVGLDIDSNGIIQKLNFPIAAPRADISLTNRAKVSVVATGGGNIAVNAQNLNLAQRSSLNAGITDNAGTAETVAGNIDVNANGAITLTESSVIQNIINLGATGNPGNINLVADSLNLLTGSQLFSSTFGIGNGGQANIQTKSHVVIDSAGNNASTSGIITSVADTGKGNAGNVNITTQSLSVNNGAQLNTITFGEGNAGNINIRTDNSVIFDGSNVGASGILSAVAPGGKGKGGNIDIITGALSISNGAQLNAITRNEGDAGNVSLQADNVTLDGENRNNGAATSIFTSVSTDDNGNQAIGNGGDINIITRLLSITNGAQLNTITYGLGNAGNVKIDASESIFLDGVNSNGGVSGVLTSVQEEAIGDSGSIDITTNLLNITGGAGLYTVTNGEGNAGNVKIQANNTVFLDGVNQNGGSSGVYSSVEVGAVGQGGDIDITTGSLRLSNGGGLFTSTYGQGNAGNANINARQQVSLAGVNSFFGGSSGVYSVVYDTGIGDGGDINIFADSIAGTQGGGLFASTYGQGNAGNVNIDARQVLFDGVTSGNSSGIFSDVQPNAVGNGRDIKITSGKLTVSNGARLSTTSNGDGSAGNIIVDANSILLRNGVFSSDTVANEGNIILRSQSLILRRNSQITTNATGINIIGGNIDIDADVLVAVENSDITANSTDFRGGNVRINTQGIFGTQFRNFLTLESDITATGADSQLSGTVEITTPDVDPSKGLIPLQLEVIDAASLINQNICAVDSGSSFTITGRGGLPPSPNTVLSNDTVWEDWRVTAVPKGNEVMADRGESRQQDISSKSKIVEAQGWLVNSQGEVILTATAPTVTPRNLGNSIPGCQS